MLTCRVNIVKKAGKKNSNQFNCMILHTRESWCREQLLWVLLVLLFTFSLVPAWIYIFIFFTVTSSCSGVKCSQLCLPKPNNQHVCACGDDFEPDPRTKECRCTGGLITMKNGTCKKPCKSTDLGRVFIHHISIALKAHEQAVFNLKIFDIRKYFHACNFRQYNDTGRKNLKI